MVLPDGLAQELEALDETFLVHLLESGLQQHKIDTALGQYAQGQALFGAAALQAGVSESELAYHAIAHGMEPPFSLDTFAEEMGDPGVDICQAETTPVPFS